MDLKPSQKAQKTLCQRMARLRRVHGLLCGDWYIAIGPETPVDQEAATTNNSVAPLRSLHAYRHTGVSAVQRRPLWTRLALQSQTCAVSRPLTSPIRSRSTRKQDVQALHCDSSGSCGSSIACRRLGPHKFILTWIGKGLSIQKPGAGLCFFRCCGWLALNLPESSSR